MKQILCFLFFVCAVCSTYADDKKLEEEVIWTAYKGIVKDDVDYYHPVVDPLRKQIFLNTNDRIESHNEKNSSWKMDHNKFSDMTEEEKAKFLGIKLTDSDRSVMAELFAKSRSLTTDEERQLPASLDLRSDKCLGPVKNQGNCGSCWAFSANTPFEYSYCKKHNNNYLSFSEQELVDCTYTRSGCSGGWPTAAWEVYKTKGGQLTTTYPYKAAYAGSCKFQASAVKGRVASYKDAGSMNEAAIRQSLKSGPVFVALDANRNFMNYKSGIFNDPSCSKTTVNHGVVIVGYATAGGVDHWIVRNSWGTGWGESGYIRMIRGVNMCNIERYPLSVEAAI